MPGVEVAGEEDKSVLDRTGQVTDPFGYSWTFATHVKDMTEAEMAAAGEAFARQQGWKK